MRRDLDDRVVGGAIVGFGVWTLLCHAVVFAGGNTHALLATTAAAGVAGAGCIAARRLRRTPSLEDPSPQPRHPDGGPSHSTSAGTPAARIAVAAIAAGAVASSVVWPGSNALWIVAVPLLLGLAFVEWRPRAGREFERLDSPPSAVHPAALWGLVIACGVLAITLHRPDADDALYLSLAVAAADTPGDALIARDTMHGFPDLPLSLPVYKVHSYELLSGALAAVTPLRVLDAAHVVMPLLAGLLLPLAWARLFKSLVPFRWLLTTALLVATLLALGHPQQGYGNFGFVRLQQGKAVLLSVMLPLVMATALEYARAPSRGRWWLLALAQIGAVGTSATGLWLAPVVAAVSLASATSIDARGIGTALRGLVASAYPVGIGLWLASDMTARFAASTKDWASHGDVQFAVDAVLGQGSLMAVSLFVLLGWWALAATAPLRRFGLAFGLAFFAVFWNPLTDSAVARAITSEPTYWRVFWIVPLPALLTLAITTPLDGARRLGFASALVATAAAVLWLAVPARWVAAPGSGAFVSAPGWKIPQEEAEAVRALARVAGPGAAVLAPPDVSQWVPALHDHPYPLVVRGLYLGVLRGRLTDDEIQRREQLTRFVAGFQRPSQGSMWLTESIHDVPLAAVCVAATSTRWPELARSLEDSRLERVWSNASYEVWARP